MCGIAGIYNYDKNDNILNDTLEIMKIQNIKYG